MCSLFKRVYLEPSQESTHYTAVWLFHPVSSNPLPLASVPVRLLAFRFTRFTLEIVTVVGFLSLFSFFSFVVVLIKLVKDAFFPQTIKMPTKQQSLFVWEESTVVCIYHCDLKLHFISVL